MIIRCRCGCDGTLEYNGVDKTSFYINGHDKTEKPKEIKKGKRNISELLKDKNRWRFVESQMEKIYLTRAAKKIVREEYNYKCIVCYKSQETQLEEAEDKNRRPTSLSIYQVNETLLVPLCAECFKLRRTDRDFLHKRIFQEVIKNGR